MDIKLFLSYIYENPHISVFKGYQDWSASAFQRKKWELHLSLIFQAHK